ncbi:MAG TPA: DUF6514 family protein [Clostridia bacterium]
MRKLELLFRNEVTLEDDRKMRLEYKLMESRSTDDGKPYYGIQIVKYLDNDMEMDEEAGISYSRDKVIAIAKTLYKHAVTPITMAEVVDDIISLEEL